MGKKTKSEHAYSVVIDKERDLVLQMMFNVTSVMMGNVWRQSLKAKNVEDVYEALGQEISDKQHAIGWCNDPNCPDSKKNSLCEERKK